MLPNENGAERGLEEMAETGLDPIAPKCPLSLAAAASCESCLCVTLSLVGGVAQWIGRRSLAGGLSLIFA